jgi:hypothetical protein
MKHAQRTEKYIRLIFNSYISDDDFFSKVHAHYRHELVFSGDFQGQEGVRIMQPKIRYFMTIVFPIASVMINVFIR